MASKEVTVPTLGMVQLNKRRGNRNIRLSVAADGHIRVSLPAWLPYQAGITFALSKADWIAKQRSVTRVVSLQDGQALGKAHHLHLRPVAEATAVASRLKTTEALVSYPAGLPVTDPKVQETARTIAIRALRNEAEALLPQRLQTLATQGNFTYKSVQIKQLKRRWGSCTQHHDIVLNLFLMQLPWPLIDYVLWHELAHTKFLHHGADFWGELTSHIPNARQLRRQIRDYNTDIR